MKNSPLQLGLIRYSDVVVRAVPQIDSSGISEMLPVQVEASVFYTTEGEHYATVTVQQKDETFPYTIEVSAFTTFTVDVEGCREAYKQQFNPAVVGVNVVRMIYSSVRDLIASITARAPYETAKIPTLIIEPKDVGLNFESDEEENILRKFFGMTDEQFEKIRQIQAAAVATEKAKKSTKKTVGAK